MPTNILGKHIFVRRFPLTFDHIKPNISDKHDGVSGSFTFTAMFAESLAGC